MRNQAFNRMSADTRSLAERFGVQTTEALIRAVSGVQQTASEGAAAARGGIESAGAQVGQGLEAAGAQVGQGIAEGAQTLATPNTSARMAWRAGRFVGRIEGAVRLGLFGVRFWWKRRSQRNAGQAQPRPEWVRSLAQWGPAVVASICIATQIWTRVRGRKA